MPFTPAIVLPVFRRAPAVKRLLTSLEAADVPPERPTLILSMEGGATQDVVTLAETFVAESRKYRVELVPHANRLGLRKHILECAGHAERFGSVIILEDDLCVDPQFYRYTTAALEHYEADEAVGGIALYAPQTNEFCRLPFLPRENGYDTYPMQTACSWGQAWSLSQWRAFIAWYETVDASAVSEELRLPPSLRNWPETSWKKYFAAWLVNSGRSFIYPYRAYATNFSDAGGTHGVADPARLQIPMAVPRRPATTFSFCPTESPEIAYDAFMEPCGTETARALDLADLSTVEIDSYGMKPPALLQRKPRCVTIRPMTGAERRFGLIRRPLEANIGHSPAPESGPALSYGAPAQVPAAAHRPDLAEYSFRMGGYLLLPRFLTAAMRTALPLLMRSLLARVLSR